MNSQTAQATIARATTTGVMHVVKGEWKYGHRVNESLCGRTLTGNGTILDDMDAITCKACFKAYSKAQENRTRQENTDRFLAESAARISAAQSAPVNPDVCTDPMVAIAERFMTYSRMSAPLAYWHKPARSGGVHLTITEWTRHYMTRDLIGGWVEYTVTTVENPPRETYRGTSLDDALNAYGDAINAWEYRHAVDANDRMFMGMETYPTTAADVALAEMKARKDTTDSVIKSHEDGSFMPACNPYVGDGVSFLTGTAKSSGDPLTRRVGEVVENISTSAGITGSIVFRSHIIREYGTNEVFEITSGRVRILNYGTWEYVERTAIEESGYVQYCMSCEQSKKITGPWNTTVAYCHDCALKIHA